MTDDQLIALAMRFFAALDARDPQALADTLAEDCIFSIETHGIIHNGQQAICELFSSRWESTVHAVHHDFTHTPSASAGRVASQFTATYSGPDAPPPKSNANVFTMADGRITKIAVYMAGENSIKT